MWLIGGDVLPLFSLFCVVQQNSKTKICIHFLWMFKKWSLSQWRISVFSPPCLVCLAQCIACLRRSVEQETVLSHAHSPMSWAFAQHKKSVQQEFVFVCIVMSFCGRNPISVGFIVLRPAAESRKQKFVSRDCFKNKVYRTGKQPFPRSGQCVLLSVSHVCANRWNKRSFSFCNAGPPRVDVRSWMSARVRSNHGINYVVFFLSGMWGQSNVHSRLRHSVYSLFVHIFACWCRWISIRASFVSNNVGCSISKCTLHMFVSGGMEV